MKKTSILAIGISTSLFLAGWSAFQFTPEPKADSLQGEGESALAFSDGSGAHEAREIGSSAAPDAGRSVHHSEDLGSIGNVNASSLMNHPPVAPGSTGPTLSGTAMVRAKTAGLARRAEFGDSLRDELAGARSESSADGIDATPSQTEMLLSDRAQVNSLSSSQQAAQAAGVAPPVAVPLAFVDGGLMEALPEGQRPALDAVQREFAATMGDVGQDPASPAYLQRWQDARRIADQQFRNMFGEQAALQMERQANLQGDRGAARQ